MNNTLIGTGTLQLDDPTGVGFTVQNVPLTLNGPGFTPETAYSGIGALDNFDGNNTWTGPITLGSPDPDGLPVSIGSETAGTGEIVTNLIITGIISDRTAGAMLSPLTKVGPGRVTLQPLTSANQPTPNLYMDETIVADGYLTVEDSQALGPVTKTNGTIVEYGASLELQTDTIIDPITGTTIHLSDTITATTDHMVFNQPLTIYGTGIENTGALHNISGINIWSGNITLGLPYGGTLPSTAAIGVDPDPNPKSDSTFFTADYSLTVTGKIEDDPSSLPGTYTNLAKRGMGQLVLTAANPYRGNTLIQQGWVVIENNTALGGRISGYGDTVQPYATVDDGAALFLLAPIPPPPWTSHATSFSPAPASATPSV